MSAVTSARHSVDSMGVPLPDASWPDEPGTAGGLEVVRRFGNTVNREQGGDAWRSVGELRSWLAAEGWRVPAATVRDLERLRSLREQLWLAVRSGDLTPLSAGAGVTGVRLAAELDGDALRWRGQGSASEIVTAELLLAVHLARFDGTWSRLKACHHCDWLFYDASRNRSGRWCSMTACGGREKARAYRRRHTG